MWLQGMRFQGGCWVGVVVKILAEILVKILVKILARIVAQASFHSGLLKAVYF
ncbi:MAG: hypothetical protein MUF49_01460 [Oculatellaceae cyanobacterium Prado106]|jgi:hypothetical protein|nr:hypothetical protein [Oculatellaceae cyanobacterium Prado106]